MSETNLVELRRQKFEKFFQLTKSKPLNQFIKTESNRSSIVKNICNFYENNGSFSSEESHFVNRTTDKINLNKNNNAATSSNKSDSEENKLSHYVTEKGQKIRKHSEHRKRSNSHKKSSTVAEEAGKEKIEQIKNEDGVNVNHVDGDENAIKSEKNSNSCSQRKQSLSSGRKHHYRHKKHSNFSSKKLSIEKSEEEQQLINQQQKKQLAAQEPETIKIQSKNEKN
jgi:hypothetical protein